MTNPSSDALADIATQLKRIADVLELDSKKFQKRQKVASEEQATAQASARRDGPVTSQLGGAKPRAGRAKPLGKVAKPA